MTLENNDSTTEAPATRRPRRRVTRAAGTPVTGTPVELPSTPAAQAATTSGSAQPATAPAAADQAPAASNPPRRRRAASRGAGSPTASDGAAPTSPAPVADESAPQAPVKKAPAKKAAEKKAAEKKAPAKKTPAKASAEPEAPSKAAPEKKAPEKKAPAKRTRASKATADSAAQGAPSDVDGTTDATTAKSSTAAPASRSGARNASRSRTPEPKATDESAPPVAPRLAGTALLFQAPEPNRRSRKQTTPTAKDKSGTAVQFAGPSAARGAGSNDQSGGQAAEPAAEPAAETPAVSQESVNDTSAPEGASPDAGASAPRSRSRKRAASRPAGSPSASSPAPGDDATRDGAAERGATQDAPAQGAATTPPAGEAVDVELSRDDAAAVAEVETIEAELVSEGVEVPSDEFEPEVEDEEVLDRPRRRRRRGGRGRRRGTGADAETRSTDESGDEAQGGDRQVSDASDKDDPASDDRDSATETSSDEQAPNAEASEDDSAGDDGSGEGSRRRRRRRRGGSGRSSDSGSRSARSTGGDEVTALKGSTRLEAKRQRRRDGRDAGRRRQIITEAEFLARRESVERSMIVREVAGRTQIAVLEDDILVEHYVSQQSQASMVGNVYVGRVQNVLPSMEAAFIDVGKGRNAVLYAGEVNWDAAGLDGQPRRIEQALKSGDPVRVQVTKDPIGHKGARLTSQVTLAGRYLVFVPGGGMTGISRKLPDTERARLKKILKEVVPEGSGVIVRTAAEGASEAELRADVERLQKQWEKIEKKTATASAPALLQGEPDMAIRVVRDIFNDDFSRLVVSGDSAWEEISSYVEELAPDLRDRVSRWTAEQDVFSVHRVDEQLAKGMDRKVWLPSGGSLVIDRTEAMTVIDVNTGKFTGAGGTLEETVTRNNLEAAEEIVRQLRLRDIGGIIVVDFIDMVLESNRDLVLRRLVECLGRDRTRHQVAEVTSLGLVQMTRKRVGQGLVEAFSETCEHCHGRGFIVHDQPIEKSGGSDHDHSRKDHGKQQRKGDDESRSRSRRRRSGGSGGQSGESEAPTESVPVLPEDTAREAVKATLATIAAAAAHAHEHEHDAEAPAGSAPDRSTSADSSEPAVVPGGAPVDEGAPETNASSPSDDEAAGVETPRASAPALDLPQANERPARTAASDVTGDLGIVLPERSGGDAPRKGAGARTGAEPVEASDRSVGDLTDDGSSSDD